MKISFMFTKTTSFITTYFRAIFLAAIVLGLALPKYITPAYQLLTPLIIISSSLLFIACLYIIFATDVAKIFKAIACLPIIFILIAGVSALDWKYIGDKIQFWKKTE